MKIQESKNDAAQHTEEKIKEIAEVLEKYFGEKETKHFLPSDELKELAGDTYIRYRFYQGRRDLVVISIGGSDIDEAPIKVCSTASSLQKLIMAII